MLKRFVLIAVVAIIGVAQAATIRRNTFGDNVDSLAVRVTDSGRSDRPGTDDVDVLNNTLGGDTIKSCGGVVTCSNNQ